MTDNGMISIEWLYLLLFILTVAFLLIAVVPEEAWPPSIKERFIEKVNLKNIKLPKFISDPNDCTILNEIKCIEDVKKNCIPTYSSKGNVFLDCDYCSKRSTCMTIKNKDACNKNLCNMSCKWIKEENVLNGKCVQYNNNNDDKNN